MIVGVPAETRPNESRVALTPAAASLLMKSGHSVVIEQGAGVAAGFPDKAYLDSGASVVAHRAAVFEQAEIVAQVRTFGANPDAGASDLDLYRPSHLIIGMSEPMTDQATTTRLAEAGATQFALELIPRITRAQSMDVLSSQANIAGYRAVLEASVMLPDMFPMMMTAAGTIAAAKVFVIGAGVAGLQAIATARRLGAVVMAFDVRPVVKEQVQSLGATFLEIDLGTNDAEDKGGYAKALDETQIRKQQEAMAAQVAVSDVVITTAAIPGRRSPVLVTAEMIEGMKPGSVIIDLAAERGGNCVGAVADEVVDIDGVKLFGPTNLPSAVARDASHMYARNVVNFIGNLLDEDGAVKADGSDEIVDGTLLARDGVIVQPRVREIFGLEPLVAASVGESSSAEAADAQDPDESTGE